MWNEEQNSEDMVVDQEENLAEFEEEDKSHDCNHNMAVATDKDGRGN